MVSDGDDSGNTGKKLYTLTTAAWTENGEYKCNGDYSGTTVQSSGETLNVREVPAASTIYIPLTKSSTEITCTVYGDDTTELKWYDINTEIVDNSVVTDVTPDYTGTYDSFSKTIKLTFANAASAQAKAYTCKASWSDGELSSIYTIDIICKYKIFRLPI